MIPTPAPGLAFVRKIETQDRYAGGSILIPEQARDRVSASQWEIVACGAPEICTDEDCERFHYDLIAADPGEKAVEIRWHEPYNLQEGDWVLVRKRAPSVTPEPDLFVVKQSDVLGKFIECAT